MAADMMAKVQMEPAQNLEDLMEQEAMDQDLLEEQMGQEQMEAQLALGPVQCDQCSARAQVLTLLPSGELWFCQHHYNKNAQALTNKGAIAKLLNVSKS